jgi:putative ABC transport system substrate-binding protein
MARHIGRRKFLATLGGAAAAWPLAARGQQPAMALVGLLSGNQLDDRWLSAVGQGLKEVGYIEGRNAAIKYRSAGGRFDRLRALAAELVADPVAVIVTLTPAAALAAKAATTVIPIVFTTGADPVNLGLVSSLNHPSGNVTGISFLIDTLESKRMELVRDLLPSATVVGFLVNPMNPASQSETRDAQVAAGALGLKLLVFNAKNEGEIDAAFASFVQQRVNTVVVGADGFFANRRDQLVGLAARHAIPAIYFLRELAIAGSLMSYGTDITDALRLAASMPVGFLRGRSPPTYR